MIKLNSVYYVKNEEYQNLLVKVVKVNKDLFYCMLVGKTFDDEGCVNFFSDNCDYFRADELFDCRKEKLK